MTTTDGELAEMAAPVGFDWHEQADRESEAHATTRKRVFDALFPVDDSRDGGLVSHARRELKAAGLWEEDADYGGMLADAVLDLIRVFADQGHSGFSAMRTLELFKTLAQFKTLTALTDNPEEWLEVDGKGLLQSRRQSSCFSDDGGRSYYDIEEVTGSTKRIYHLTEPTGKQEKPQP